MKFALWCLSQDDKFFASSPIWNDVLGEQVGLSREQLDQLKEFRGMMIEAKQSLQNVQGRLQKLREGVLSHMNSRHQHLDELRHLLTPEQVARFMLWVDNNPLVIQMLDTVWRL